MIRWTEAEERVLSLMLVLSRLKELSAVFQLSLEISESLLSKQLVEAASFISARLLVAFLRQRARIKETSIGFTSRVLRT